MSWLGGPLIGTAIFMQTVAPAPAHGIRDGVVANCDDFVRVTPLVFTGREGAWFEAGGERDYLGQDTFGPGALRIGGIDPALYLGRRCTGR